MLCFALVFFSEVPVSNGAVHKNSGPPSTHLPLTGGDLQLTEGHGDYPGVGEEERRYECHDEFPKEGLSEGEFTLTL